MWFAARCLIAEVSLGLKDKMPSSSFTAGQSVTPTMHPDRRWLAVILIVAGLLRLGVVCWKPDALLEDRDLYWGIAQRVAVGDGFVHPELGHATAYRPPLYPLLLALIVSSGGGLKLLAAVQIALGTATVWLTWMLGRHLSLGRRALLAAALVAINPLLVQATSLAMTETLFTFLVTACLLAAITNRWITLGVFVGLAMLCRPTMFAFVGLSSVVFLACHFWFPKPVGRDWRSMGLALLVCVVIIAPWGLRNGWLFGKPIITTTHGGYTLLLGNNDEAYRAEVERPLRTLWDSRPWQRSLEEELQRVGIAPADEVLRDRWMSERAWTWITSHPHEFTAACWLRVKRFWNVSPVGSDAATFPRAVLWGIAIFYTLELIAAAAGVWRLSRDEWATWLLLLLLILSFFAVHIIYWSNMRMRAPIEPALCLFALKSWGGTKQIACQLTACCRPS